MATTADDVAAADRDERARPPFLRRVRIRNYKSIEFCDVALQPLTILVGRNASGKSNFLDALAFLRDLINDGLKQAVILHGSSRSILPRWSDDTVVRIEIETDWPRQGANSARLENYAIEVDLPDSSSPTIVSERFRLIEAEGREVSGFDRDADGRLRILGPNANPKHGAPKHSIIDFPRDIISLGPITRYFLNLHDSPHLGYSFFKFRHYNFSPGSIRELQRLTPDGVLERDGRNLAGVIERIGQAEAGKLDRLRAYLTTIAEGVTGFETVHYGEYETVKFQVEAGPGEPPMAFDAASMSDGTLHALATLVAAFQFTLPDGPDLITFEEPETGLHPVALWGLMDALSEASESIQILLTTHSADILDNREVQPSQVLVVRSRGGRTQIAPVDAASREIIERELSSLADLQRQDHLDLNRSDLERQAAGRAREGGE